MSCFTNANDAAAPVRKRKTSPLPASIQEAFAVNNKKPRRVSNEEEAPSSTTLKGIEDSKDAEQTHRQVIWEKLNETAFKHTLGQDTPLIQALRPAPVRMKKTSPLPASVQEALATKNKKTRRVSNEATAPSIMTLKGIEDSLDAEQTHRQAIWEQLNETAFKHTLGQDTPLIKALRPAPVRMRTTSTLPASIQAAFAVKNKKTRRLSNEAEAPSITTLKGIEDSKAADQTYRQATWRVKLNQTTFQHTLGQDTPSIQALRRGSLGQDTPLIQLLRRLPAVAHRQVIADNFNKASFKTDRQNAPSVQELPAPPSVQELPRLPSVLPAEQDIDPPPPGTVFTTKITTITITTITGTTPDGTRTSKTSTTENTTNLDGTGAALSASALSRESPSVPTREPVVPCEVLSDPDQATVEVVTGQETVVSPTSPTQAEAPCTSQQAQASSVPHQATIAPVAETRIPPPPKQAKVDPANTDLRTMASVTALASIKVSPCGEKQATSSFKETRAMPETVSSNLQETTDSPASKASSSEKSSDGERESVTFRRPHRGAPRIYREAL
jgi:hypothetical protein